MAIRTRKIKGYGYERFEPGVGGRTIRHQFGSRSKRNDGFGEWNSNTGFESRAKTIVSDDIRKTMEEQARRKKRKYKNVIGHYP